MEIIFSSLLTQFNNLPWMDVAIYIIILTHITIVGVTLYLHRDQTHMSIELKPVVRHIFRFWLWLTTGMITKQWAAIHRKHHAHVEKWGDPHSPKIFGIRKVVFQGTELYRTEAKNRITLETFGHGTPNDWIERNIYTRHCKVGIVLMLVIDLYLFGFLGLTVWAIQMIWIPFFAAGVINGLGHYCGYRNFDLPDNSHNIIPWGVLIGGEELHNNHHEFGSSARFSAKWFEIDIGWVYINILAFFGLCEILRDHKNAK